MEAGIIFFILKRTYRLIKVLKMDQFIHTWSMCKSVWSILTNLTLYEKDCFLIFFSIFLSFLPCVRNWKVVSSVINDASFLGR